MWIGLETLAYSFYLGIEKGNKDPLAEQVLIWRRSYDMRPPVLSEHDERYPGKDSRYSAIGNSNMPVAESLKDTIARVIPYWENVIAPQIKKGSKVIIVTHGNSLRALVKHLDNVSDTEIIKLNIPTGIPLVYELDDNLAPTRKYYIGDTDRITESIKKVEQQGKSI